MSQTKDLNEKKELGSKMESNEQSFVKFRGTNLELQKDSFKEVSLEDNANFFSRFLLLYLNPLLQLGSEKALMHEDIGGTSRMDQAGELHTAFEREWKKELQKPADKVSLWFSMIRAIGIGRLCLGIGLYGIYAATTFVPIIILNALVKHFEGIALLPTSLLWIYVALLFVVPMVGSLCSAQNGVVTAHIGVQFRNLLIGALYRKSLILSNSSRQQTSTGQIVNMFSNDTSQIQNLMFFAGMISFAPAQIAVALALIYQQVGNATWVGLAFMIVLFPVNGLIFGLMTSIRKKKVIVTDSRVKMMNEILGGIRIIKFYAWEDAFRDKVNKIRDKEMVLLTRLAYVVAIGFSLILMSAPVIQPVLVFFTYIKLGYNLDAATAFTTISLFNVMRFPFAFLPMGLAQWSQAKVALKRMTTFLLSEEMGNNVERVVGTDSASGNAALSDDVVLHLKNVNLSWVKEEDEASVEVKGDKKGKSTKKNEKDKTSKPASKAGSSRFLIYKSVAADEKKENDLQVAAGTVPKEEEIAKVNRAVHTLVDLNVEIKRGQLVAVVGPVGSGKSSLIAGILGELHVTTGKIHQRGTISYCDQRPWILNATLKDNVTFGEPFDEMKFESALYASALEDDIKVLQGGVMTEIGERGINLSGGQKARVALARAVYKNADLYLLDDPLSAVDAHVGQHIFNECIVGALAGKTRILVTHHVHLLPQCDLIIVLDEGKVRICGTYDDLMKSDLDLQAILPSSAEEAAPETEKKIENEIKTESHEVKSATEATEAVTSISDTADKEAGVTEDVSDSGKTTSDPTDSTPDTGPESKVDNSSAIAKAKADLATPAPSNKSNKSKLSLDNRSSSIMTSEERDKGAVDNSVYSYYVKAGGWFWYLILVLIMVAAGGLDVGSSFWLAFWSDQTLTRNLDSNDNLYYLNMYALICMLNVICLTIRGLILAQHRLGTSLKLHSELLVSILGAPVSFFDTTPLGRILNRFSSDILTVDETLSQTLSQMINSMFSVLNSAVGIAASTNGTFMILLIPLYFLYDRIQKFFRKSNTEIQRLTSTSLSPIYADFSQALNGVSTIRAYGMVERFTLQMEDSVDRNSVCAVLQQVVGQWLAIRLDLITAIVSCFIAALAVGAGTSFIPSGYLALALSYSLSMTQYLKFAVRMVATAEANMNSVERIKHYAHEVEQEGGLSAGRKPPAEDWPTHGVVEAKNVSLRYRDGPLVLKNISFETKSSEKIGIAGRTGSGKSSLMAALFRIVELEDGWIKIDGKDCSLIPLKTLRSKLGIIPQDPVMFSATVRFNLDPFDMYPDTQIWDILDVVELKDFVQSLPNKLEELVAESGENFSAGQRQLICIARALLRRPKVLVLDEATASVDNETDARMQLTIKERFKDCTVLTIAHRLHTIVDSDRVMVLEQGEVSELDKPDDLLVKEGGMFRSLWERHKLSHGKGSSKSDLQALAEEESAPEEGKAAGADA